jgi:phospholipid/cholesterol/gamma-HCH transport system ATP-binding protein
MRTAEYMGVLFRSRLVRFASKEEMTTTDNAIIRQFLSGRAKGPIGIDELSDASSDIEAQLEAQEDERMGDEPHEIMTV